MNTVSSESLVHFTAKFSTLKKILSRGLRYSYALEHFQNYAPVSPEILSEDDFSLEGVAIPMICFCDIPFNLVYKHALDYGQFFIAFDKFNIKLLLGEKLNPLFYIDSEESYNMLQILDDKRNDNRISRISEFLLAMSKPFSGFDIKGRHRIFYDEREWRLFYYPGENPFCQWYRNLKLREGSEYSKWIEDKNQRLHNSEFAYLKLGIPSEYLMFIVSYIGVKNDSYRESLIKFISNTKTILGIDNISETTRLNLISKIISFERIRTDF